MSSYRIAEIALKVLTCAVCVGSASVNADIIWSGDFSTGNFLQWHKQTDNQVVMFSQVPPYGRPPQYGGQGSIHIGDGSLLSLVAETQRTVNDFSYAMGPTRGTSEYSAKVVVKNSADGDEGADCDVPYGSAPNCKVRRTELTVQGTLPLYYDALPLMSERWLSYSVYVPPDWDDLGNGWGITLFQLKSQSPNTLPMFEIQIHQGEWQIMHRWTDIPNGTQADGAFPWQHQMKYTPNYPRVGSSEWSDVRDFPEDQSQAALGSVLKGGWTDWIMQVEFDPFGTDKNGSGFLTLWKREGSGPWVKVLHIRPKETTRGGLTFNHGIGINHENGFGIKSGMYGSKSQFWDLAKSRTIYVANIKVGDSTSRFSEMSPDGTAPGDTGSVEQAVPKPPEISPIE